MNTIVSPSAPASPVTAPYKIDISRGRNDSRVSSQWFSRPADQRFLNLDDLYASVKRRKDESFVRTIDCETIRVEADPGDSEKLTLTAPSIQGPIAPNHWSFGQMCTLAKAPSSYLRGLPGAIAGINLQWGLQSVRSEQIKLMASANPDTPAELRAATGPEYGRIWDYELVQAVQRIAGNGTGDTRWKIPGVMNWSNMTHNPHVNVTKDTTTLYASDRDVFIFLCDDAHPIVAGKLPNGDDDVYFRGFYVWNSEVGAKTRCVPSTIPALTRSGAGCA